MVIAGNHSLLALRAMEVEGSGPPENVRLSDTGSWMAPCLDISHLTKAQAKAFGIADNRIPLHAEDSDERLSALLKEIAKSDAKLLGALGVDEEELSELLSVSAHSAAAAAADPYAEFPSVAGKRGDQKCPKCGYEWKASA